MATPTADPYIGSAAHRSGRHFSTPTPGREIVISGLAGFYPESNSVTHFRDNLYNKIDLITEDNRRWEHVHPEIPTRSGKLHNIDKFDAGFFGVHYRQAESMDPVARLLLERTVEAIYDAGINPAELEGTKTGVFVGTCFSENEKTWFYESQVVQGFAVAGNERSMIPNRISYALKLKGPSFITDTACSSSIYALEAAYTALWSNACDTALVVGGNLCLHPCVSLQFFRLGVLSKDGNCKCFDDKANGYVRSEAMAAIVLQRSKDARRIYSTIVYVKTNCDGFKPQSITYPSGETQKKLLQEFYIDCEVDPSTLSYMEAHGTGTVVGDPEELQAIDEVFCRNRTTPLLIGSVKSNIGHSEPSSSLSSITKAIIALENGLIPPNINFSTPRKGIDALEKGRVKVVTEKTPFQDGRGLIGVNSFGFGGANGHVLLHWNDKIKVAKGLPQDPIPRLVCVSGRTEEALNSIFDDLVSRPLDVEHVRLYHQIFSRSIATHAFRGYVLTSTTGEIHRSYVKNPMPKPLYLTFTSTIPLWSPIIEQLKNLPIFAASLQRIDAVLSKTKNFNVLDVVLNGTNHPDQMFCDILGTMVLQFAIVDILSTLKIQPTQIFGTGCGEFACGYFTGALTLSEAVLCVFEVAQNWKSAQSKLVPLLKAIITQPKTKPQQWASGSALLADADFFGNSLTSTSSTNFEHHFHNDSVVINIGTHSFGAGYFTVVQLEAGDSIVNVFKLLGTIYQAGYCFAIDLLYPTVEFPVSRGTPMISNVIKWEHQQSWFVTSYDSESHKNGESSILVSSKDEEWSFIIGHMIEDRNLFPATGYLLIVWQVLSVVMSAELTEMQVIFENVKFLRATNVPKESKVELKIIVQKGSGIFEVVEGDSIVVNGRIFLEKTKNQLIGLPLPLAVPESVAPIMTQKDIYKELRLRGYNYKGQFRHLQQCDNSVTKSIITWDGNWVTFMDNMLQMKILQTDTRNLYVPTGIKRLVINTKEHIKYVKSLGDSETQDLPVYIHEYPDIIKSGGIEITGLTASSIARRKPRGLPVLEKYVFVPNETKLSTEDSIRTIAQIVLESLPDVKVKAVEVVDESTDPKASLLTPIVQEVLGDLPLIQPTLTILTGTSPEALAGVTIQNTKLTGESDATIVIASGLFQRGAVLNQAFGALRENGFVLSRERLDFNASKESESEIVAIFTTPTEKLYLLRRVALKEPSSVVDISEINEAFQWLPLLKKAVVKDPNVLVIVQNQPLSGILGLINCLRREPGCGSVRAIFTFDSAPPFNIKDPFYRNQLKKDLAVNVYKNKQWGTYRHLLIDEKLEVEANQIFSNCLVRGDLSSMRWLQGPLTFDTKAPDEKCLVSICYSSLNFRDIMTATGKINADLITTDRTKQEFVQGFEFSGYTIKGKRMMGISVGTLSNLTIADQYFSWPVPEAWSLEEAATVPVVYATVLESLFVRCSIRKGQSILIHAGTGGIGQAAINICLFHGLIVYTTVGTQEKRDFIKKTFPQLTDHHIGNSRDTSFEQLIYSQTKGRGVDYVLNSLAEEKLLASVNCLARGGSFVEIGKFDLANNNPLRLLLLVKEASFHGVMLDSFLDSEPNAKRAICKLVVESIANGSLKPLQRTVFQRHEIEQAFRFMGAGKHMGKVLLQIQSKEPQKDIKPSSQKMRGLPRFYCNPQKIHVIIGGLGGFGLELADWLVTRGAKNLLLTSRRGLTTGYQAYRLKIWKTYNVKVHISTIDIITKDGCNQLIDEAQAIAPIQSIFNLAVVLRDGILENQTAETFTESFKPKAWATTHLDEITRRRCADLRDFVIFSSVSCGRGNAGQTNYGMANSIMERICEKRHEDGFPALAIEWGAIGDVGLVAEMQEEHTQLEIGGTLQQSIANCLQVLDPLLSQPFAIVSSMVVAEKRGGSGGGDDIVATVANILGIHDLKTVSLHAPLAEIGMDSMTAVEIKQMLERDYELVLAPQDIRELTLAKLQEIQDNLESVEGALQERPLAGFEIIVRLINDEATSKLHIVPLPTLNEKPPKTLFFPGVEGVAKGLNPLALNLKIQGTALQYPVEIQEDTIAKMALLILPLVESQISKSEPFSFIAYSFGCNVALEIVALLEKKGYHGNVILIDGSPLMLRSLVHGFFEVDSEALFQTELLAYIISLQIDLRVSTENREKLLAAPSFRERVDIAVGMLMVDLSYPVAYLRSLMFAIYSRVKAVGVYEPQFKLKSKVTLLKPHLATAAGLSDDYDLGRLCLEPVEVHAFNGNHVTVLESLDLAVKIEEILMVRPREE